MKTVVLAIGLVLVPAVASAKEVKNEFSVEGWSCAGCAQKTAKVLLGVKGVKSATPNLDKKVLAVAYDDEVVKASDIEAAIKKSKPGCD